MALVWTAESAVGRPDMLQPPVKADSEFGCLYETTVDNTTEPNMHCVFADGQAYAAYELLVR